VVSEKQSTKELGLTTCIISMMVFGRYDGYMLSFLFVSLLRNQ